MADAGADPISNVRALRDGVEPVAAEAYKALVEAVDGYAIVLLSRDGRILSWNPGAEKMKGYRAEDIVGRSFETFYPPEAVAVGHPARELEVAALIGRYEEEGWRVRADGSRFWARVLIVARYDDEGELEGYGKVTTDLTADRQRQEQVANTMRLLEQSVRIDALTGLPNRRCWDERIAEEFARAERTGEPLSVGIVDLDHFKRVNDSGGHAAGDRLLKQASLQWRRVLRPTDLVARYGGEEFAVALPGVGLEEAVAILDRLREATPQRSTCSIGVAVVARGETVSAVLGRADRAMYAAKAAGRNRVCAA